MIFEWTAEMDQESPLKVSYVSAEWRNVGLQCHSLWTYYRGNNQHWLDTVIHRSGSLPLHIDLPINESSAANQNVITEMHRVRELSLERNGRGSWNDILQALEKGTAVPLLEKLKIIHNIHSADTEYVLYLPDDMFKGLALPRLKTLELSRQTPDLRFLKLYPLYNPVDEVGEDGIDPVELHHLRELHVNSDQCEVILSQIKYPAIQHIVVRPTEKPTLQTFYLLCTFLAAKTFKPIRHMRIQSHDESNQANYWVKNRKHQIDFLGRFWEAPASEPPPGVPDIRIELYSSVGLYQYLIDGMKHLLSALETLDIDTRDVQPTSETQNVDWFEALGDLENLTAIRIQCAGSMKPFLETLCSTFSEAWLGTLPPVGALLEIPRQYATDTLCFRSLRTLVLHYQEFDDDVPSELTNCLEKRRRLLGHHERNIETSKFLNVTLIGPEGHAVDVLEQVRMRVSGDIDVMWDVRVV
ncbi:hypothetical protein H0H92_008674 [Tricholoma furcatifolium]|nr:hypothetical protein H0H92_008674 [Tricholoma furcatifolium]